MPKVECRKCGKANGPNIPLNADYAGWLCDSCYDKLQNALKEGDLLQEIATLRAERDRLRKAYGDLGEEANSLRAELEDAKAHYRLVEGQYEAYKDVATEAAQNLGLCITDKGWVNAQAEELLAELSRERERHQNLRQVVKQYRRAHIHNVETNCFNADPDPTAGAPDYRCAICIKADALLEPQPAPVDTGGK